MLLEQLKVLIEDCNYELSILSNVSALLNQSLEDISWVGFYLYQDDQLILGPFQGKVACTNIPIGKGVCGTTAQNKTTTIVPNVHEFAGHIACDSATNSEIVVPIFVNEKFYGILDIDSISFDRFNVQDQLKLEQAMTILGNKLASM